MNPITELEAFLADLDSHVGEAETDTVPPYLVIAPLFLGTAEAITALSGDALGWDTQISVYCCGASVLASFNLAVEVMRRCQGQWLAGQVMTTSMGYVGAPVNGHYESQVTIQINQGELS